MLRLPHRAVPIALFAVVVDAIGFGIVMPVLPNLVTALGHVGLDEAARISGWMLAVFAIGQFFAGPVLGALADQVGRRRVLLLSMAAFAIDYALMAVAPTLTWLFAGRVIAGVAGATMGTAGAVLADVTPPERRAVLFGYMSAAFGVGFMVGPALGGLVAGLGDRAPFVVAAACAGVNALVILALLPETLAPENRRPFRWREAHVVGSFRPLFGAGNATPLLVAWFLWQLGGMVYPATWSFWATIRFGWGPAEIGWSLAYVGLMTVLVQLLLTQRAVARLGERMVAVVGLGCGAATMFAYAVADRPWQVYAFFLVGALGALAYPALSGIASRMADASRQGALQGGLASISSVAAILGPPIAAQSLAVGHARGMTGAAFLVAGGLIAAAAIIVAVGLPRLRPAEGH